MLVNISKQNRICISYEQTIQLAVHTHLIHEYVVLDHSILSCSKTRQSRYEVET